MLSKLGWKPVLWDWQKPLFYVLTAMIPVWLAMAWALRDASNWFQMTFMGGVLTLIGAWVALRHALPSDLVDEIMKKLSPSLRWMAISSGKTHGKA
jgi:disulfide bond formation protein DsbB